MKNFYEELKGYSNWVCRDVEAITDKEKKIPYHPSGYKASSTDPKTWSTFQECLDSKYGGYGFVLSPEDGICAIDLDHCIDEESKEINTYAMFILKLCGSGAEISQSGSGAHIFGLGKIPHALKTTKIEVYSKERYIATTGNILVNLPLVNMQVALDEIYRGNKQIKKQNFKIGEPIPVGRKEFKRLFENSGFKSIWKGNSEYLKDDGSPDWSRYDYNIASSLRELQPEKILWIQKYYRELHGAPKKHLGALVNAIQKTNIWKEFKQNEYSMV